MGERITITASEITAASPTSDQPSPPVARPRSASPIKGKIPPRVISAPTAPSAPRRAAISASCTCSTGEHVTSAVDVFPREIDRKVRFLAADE